MPSLVIFIGCDHLHWLAVWQVQLEGVQTDPHTLLEHETDRGTPPKATCQNFGGNFEFVPFCGGKK